MPKTYEAIMSTTLTTNSSSVTFSSIPQTYTDLVLICAYDLVSGGGSMALRLNNDSAGNYGVTYIFGNGSSAASSRVANITYVAAGRAGVGGQGGGYTHIMSYSNTTTFKSVLSRSFGTIGSASPWFDVTTWRSTAAITSLVLLDESGGTFASGATFNLYGIKAA
jgi:hypothetical protein